MALMLFDTHTHLNAEEFDEEIPETLQRAKEHDVSRMAVVGFDLLTIEKTLTLSEKYPEVFSIIVGIQLKVICILKKLKNNFTNNCNYLK